LLIWRHVPDFSEGYVRLSLKEKRRLINAVVSTPDDMSPDFFLRAQSEVRASILPAFSEWVATEEWKSISYQQIVGPSFIASLRVPALSLALKKHLTSTVSGDDKILKAFEFCEAVFALEKEWSAAEAEEDKESIRTSMVKALKKFEAKKVFGHDAAKKLSKYIDDKGNVPRFIDAVESYSSEFDKSKPYMEWLWKKEWVGIDYQMLTLKQTKDLSGFTVPPTLACVLTNEDLLKNFIPFCTQAMQSAVAFLREVISFSEKAYEERKNVSATEPEKETKEAEMEVFDVEGFKEPMDGTEKHVLSKELYDKAHELYKKYIDEDSAGGNRVLLDPLLERRFRKSVTGFRSSGSFDGNDVICAGCYVYHSICDSWYRELLGTLFYVGCSYNNSSFEAREAEKVFDKRRITGIATLWLPTVEDIYSNIDLQTSFFVTVIPSHVALVLSLQESATKFRACVSAAERAAEAQNVRAHILLLTTDLDPGFVRPFNAVFAAAENAGLGDASPDLFDLPILLILRHILQDSYADWLHILGRANASALNRDEGATVPCLCSDFAGVFYSEMCDPVASAQRHANLVRKKRLEHEKTLAEAFFASGGKPTDFEDEDLSECSESAGGDEWSDDSSHSGTDSYADAVEYGLKVPSLDEMLESTYWRRVFGLRYLSMQLVDDELVLWAALNDFFERFRLVGDAKMAASQDDMRQAAIRICNRHSACLRNAGPLKSRLTKNCFISARFFREEEEILYARFYEDFQKKLINKGFKPLEEDSSSPSEPANAV